MADVRYLVLLVLIVYSATSQDAEVTTAIPSEMGLTEEEIAEKVLCEDNDNECRFWADQGECQNNPGWMHINCRQSCGLCADTTVEPRCVQPMCAVSCVGNAYILDEKGCQTCECEIEECRESMIWSDCGSQCNSTCDEPRPRCTKECVARCQCPVGTVMHEGACIVPEACPRDHHCTGGQVWADCGSQCTPTCDRRIMPCPLNCVPRCECPSDKPLWHHRECVAPEDCDNPCSIGRPLEDEFGEDIFCGRGPSRRDCPDTHVCNVNPTDAGAVCCSKVTGSQCHLQLQQTWRGFDGLFRPHCYENGTYAPLQCTEESCWCIYSDGSEVEGSSVPIEDGEPECNMGFPCATVMCMPMYNCVENILMSDEFGCETCECAETCPEGMVWYDCGSACNRTCDEPYPLCTEQCVRRCDCPEGYLLHEGTCVQDIMCPQECPGGKVFKECGSACTRTCEDSYPMCTMQCVEKCECPNERPIWHEGECIEESQCPSQPQCENGQVWFDCTSPCNKSCDEPEPFCRQPCVPRCDCPNDMVMHEGYCIPRMDCPRECSGGKVFNECGSACTSICDNKLPMCTRQCVAKCQCPSERPLWHNGTCITEDECPVQCEGGQVFKECGSACTRTCDDNPLMCTMQCVKKCECPNERPIWHEGECIEESQCPSEPQCENGQVWFDCTSPCNKSCDEPEPFCRRPCVPRCDCPKGMVMHEGSCIPPMGCPRECSGGKVFNECGSACTRTCDDKLPMCTRQCVAKCQCPFETPLWHDGTCITEDKCPVQCEGGQVFNECGSACTRTCDDGQPVCTMQCVEKCECPNERPIWHEGECIEESQCPSQPQCENGQIWHECGSACQPTCENPAPMFCTLQCVAQCQCPAEAPIFHDGECISLTECPGACYYGSPLLGDDGIEVFCGRGVGRMDCPDTHVCNHPSDQGAVCCHTITGGHCHLTVQSMWYDELTVGEFIPQCKEDGGFEAMQCHSSTGYCWCVDELGQEIPNTAGRPWEREVNCTAIPGCPSLEECEMECPFGHRTDAITGCELCECNCPPVCHMYCEYGYVFDENGCQTCRCQNSCEGVVCSEPRMECWPWVAPCLVAPCPYFTECVLREEFIPDTCMQRPDSEDCGSSERRYFYNHEMRECQTYMYGGCDLSENNFATNEECEELCTRVPVICPEVVCPSNCETVTIQGDNGCDVCVCKNRNECPLLDDCDLECRFGYKTDDDTGCEICACECSRIMCKMGCPHGFETDENGCNICKCHRPCENVTCSGYSECWPRELPCNSPPCAWSHECVRILDAVLPECLQPLDEGDCGTNETRYYFNVGERTCKEFQYGGCDTSGNNFATVEDCHSSCVNPIRPHCPIPQCPADCMPEMLFNENGCLTCICTTPQCPSMEECPLSCIHGYEIDVAGCPVCSCACDPFMCHMYCDHGFRDDANGCPMCQCRSACEVMICAEGEICVEPQSFCQPGNSCEPTCLVPDGPQLCYLAPDAGPCEAMPAWYYNAAQALCLQFMYGGCEGNGNRFESREECENSCLSMSLCDGEDHCRLTSCRYGLLRNEEENCNICACAPRPCLECDTPEQCPYGFRRDTHGCDLCDQCYNPCMEMQCDFGKECISMVEPCGGMDCISPFRHASYCVPTLRNPLCRGEENLLSSSLDGCPVSRYAFDPVTQNCFETRICTPAEHRFESMEACEEMCTCPPVRHEEFCEFGPMYDDDGCHTQQCQFDPCWAMLCMVGTTCQHEQIDPSCSGDCFKRATCKPPVMPRSQMHCDNSKAAMWDNLCTQTCDVISDKYLNMPESGNQRVDRCPGNTKCCNTECGSACMPAVPIAMEPRPRPCEEARDLALHQIAMRLTVPVTVPFCMDDTMWEQVQCNLYTGQCWCADQNNGQPIPGTRTRGVPQCNSLPSLTDRQDEPVCPLDATPLLSCSPLMCELAHCSGAPHVICRVNPCGETCSIEWWDERGRLPDEYCERGFDSCRTDVTERLARFAHLLKYNMAAGNNPYGEFVTHMKRLLERTHNDVMRIFNGIVQDPPERPDGRPMPGDDGDMMEDSDELHPMPPEREPIAADIPERSEGRDNEIPEPMGTPPPSGPMPLPQSSSASSSSSSSSDTSEDSSSTSSSDDSDSSSEIYRSSRSASLETSDDSMFDSMPVGELPSPSELELTGPISFYLPLCRPPYDDVNDGFMCKQCQGNHCWCVDRFGQPLPETLSNQSGLLTCTLTGRDASRSMDSHLIRCPDDTVPTSVCENSCNSLTGLAAFLHSSPGGRSLTCRADVCNDCREVLVDVQTGEEVSLEELGLRYVERCVLPGNHLDGQPCIQKINGSDIVYSQDQPELPFADHATLECPEVDRECPDACAGLPCEGMPEATCVVDPCTCRAIFMDLTIDDEVTCDLDHGICERHNYVAIMTAKEPDEVMRLTCNEDGGFSPMQCKGDECWCVMADGKEVANTRMSDSDANRCVERGQPARVDLKIVFNAYFQTISRDIDAFALSMQEQLADKLGVRQELVNILQVREGSIIVEAQVVFSDTPGDESPSIDEVLHHVMTLQSEPEGTIWTVQGPNGEILELATEQRIEAIIVPKAEDVSASATTSSMPISSTRTSTPATYPPTRLVPDTTSTVRTLKVKKEDKLAMEENIIIGVTIGLLGVFTIFLVILVCWKTSCCEKDEKTIYKMNGVSNGVSNVYTVDTKSPVSYA